MFTWRTGLFLVVYTYNQEVIISEPIIFKVPNTHNYYCLVDGLFIQLNEHTKYI